VTASWYAAQADIAAACSHLVKASATNVAGVLTGGRARVKFKVCPERSWATFGLTPRNFRRYIATAGDRLETKSTVGASVLVGGCEAEGVKRESARSVSTRLFDNVDLWKEEKRRRRSSCGFAEMRTDETLTTGVSVTHQLYALLQSEKLYVT